MREICLEAQLEEGVLAPVVNRFGVCAAEQLDAAQGVGMVAIQVEISRISAFLLDIAAAPFICNNFGKGPPHNGPLSRLPPAQVVFGLVMGRAADVYNRKLIVFYGLVIWSFATLWLGLSNNYTQLLQSRILLGIGESFSMPASFSMIADYFPIESLAQVSAQTLQGFPYCSWPRA